jgi:hypothetical protein
MGHFHPFSMAMLNNQRVIHNHALINYDQLCKILQKSRDLFTEIAEGR